MILVDKFNELIDNVTEHIDLLYETNDMFDNAINKMKDMIDNIKGGLVK